MDANLIIKVVAAIGMGITLSACAGLRAFLPLAVLSICAKLGSYIGYNIPLTEHFNWLNSWISVACFSAAVIVEIIGDKFPAIDHLLDSVAVFIKPIAGMLVAAAVFTSLPPIVQMSLAIILGGGLAEGVHLLKAGARGLSSVTTFGLANPILSTVEDVSSLSLSILAIILPVIAGVIVLILVVFAYIYIKKRRRAVA